MLITILIHEDGEIFNIINSSGPFDQYCSFIMVEVVTDNDKEKTI